MLDLPSYLRLEWLLYMVHESVNALRCSENRNIVVASQLSCVLDYTISLITSHICMCLVLFA